MCWPPCYCTPKNEKVWNTGWAVSSGSKWASHLENYAKQFLKLFSAVTEHVCPFFEHFYRVFKVFTERVASNIVNPLYWVIQYNSKREWFFYTYDFIGDDNSSTDDVHEEKTQTGHHSSPTFSKWYVVVQYQI